MALSSPLDAGHMRLSKLLKAATVCVIYVWGVLPVSCYAGSRGTCGGHKACVTEIGDSVLTRGCGDGISHATKRGNGWYVSTSLPAWCAAIVNVAGEWAFSDRWSADLGVAYSAWDYGQSIRKFRTLSLRPEMRYWFGCGHRGLFIESHMAMIYYNVALPKWEWRIQDAGGHHPALGGGIGVGYRFDITGNGRWSMECALGGGVYALRYDRFANRPGGKLHDTVSRTWVGIDHVSLSFVYSFNLK